MEELQLGSVHYEEINEPYREPSILNAQRCEGQEPDGSDCINPATIQYLHRDEEEMVFITNRCADHPEDDPDYVAREL